jgi:hypothetical protein
LESTKKKAKERTSDGNLWYRIHPRCVRYGKGFPYAAKNWPYLGRCCPLYSYGDRRSISNIRFCGGTHGPEEAAVISPCWGYESEKQVGDVPSSYVCVGCEPTVKTFGVASSYVCIGCEQPVRFMV